MVLAEVYLNFFFPPYKGGTATLYTVIYIGITNLLALLVQGLTLESKSTGAVVKRKYLRDYYSQRRACRPCKLKGVSMCAPLEVVKQEKCEASKSVVLLY